MVYAVSLQGHLERYGAYIGLAAFLGLAVLALLSFAQARELRRLREWAGSAPERLYELEQRVRSEMDAMGRRVKAQPLESAAQAVISPVSPTPPLPHSGGAVDIKGPGPLGATALVDQPTQPHSVLGPQSAVDSQQEAVTNQPVLPVPTPVPPPAPVQIKAEAVSPLGSDSKRPAPAALMASSVGTRRARQTTDRAAGSRPRRKMPRWFMLAGAIAGVVTVVTLAATLLLGGSDKPVESPKAKVNRSVVKRAPIAVEHKRITVAVLNGTAITGLASSTSDRLTRAGFTPGSTGNSADQQQPTSLVLYAPNKRDQALEVARQLNIHSVQQADLPTQTRAGSNADVIVIVGADQAP